jgi:hypothetical protein
VGKATGIAGARVRVEELPRRIACMCARTHEGGNNRPVRRRAQARVRVEITVSKKGGAPRAGQGLGAVIVVCQLPERADRRALEYSEDMQ